MACRAVQSDLLEQRIAENRASQEVDLVSWIFDRVHVSPDAQVLELCCGTGGQTLPLLGSVGKSGRVVAVDVAQDALDVVAAKARGYSDQLVLVRANLDDLSSGLEASLPETCKFDLIFCAYGLYYSSDASKTLDEALSWLAPGGRLVVVGPFGPNNQPLFDLVRGCGASIAESVLCSSQRFMFDAVLPWGRQNFKSITVHTMVNRVRWSTPERVMNYWQNTTFYDPQRRPAFESLLQLHFEKHSEFVNEKWVMLVEMAHARS